MAEKLGASLLTELAALQLEPPFSGEVTTAFRRMLGDFRNYEVPDSFSPKINERAKAIYARGFEPALAAFPRGSYWSVLDAVGIREPRPSQPAPAPAPRQRKLRAYLLLVHFESTLRRFVAGQLSREFGESWLVEAVPAEKREKWRKYQGNETEGHQHEEIEYSDLVDFIPIVTKKDNWDRIVSKYFENPESFKESIHRLNPWRRRVAHSRGGWAKQELLSARVEVHRLLVAMGIEDSLDDLEIRDVD